MKIKNLAIGSALILMSLSSGVVASAAEASKAESKADFTLQAGDGETVPEVTEPIGPGTGNKGPLSIDAVSSFNFGSDKISEKQATYEAIVEKGQSLGVQVTDQRGTGAGWDLKVKISEFKNEDQKRTLVGAKLSIPKGTITTTSATTTAPPIATGLTLNQESNIIFSAAKETGLGTWVNIFENSVENGEEEGETKAGNPEKVELEVPTGNYADKYSATINWSLEDAPK